MPPIPPVKTNRVTTLMDYVVKPHRRLVQVHQEIGRALSKALGPKKPSKPKE